MKQRNGSNPSSRPACSHGGPAGDRPAPDPGRLERAARLFRAMGDGPRLRLLHDLSHGECCVTEIVARTGEKFPTVSQRLRVLRSEGLVKRRRVGTHVYYALADRHVARLVRDALAHAGELEGSEPHSHDGED
jgi:ArsR family transcriptional regulator, lead/cadmium/zinc/bismuth-responsive transcriptional repressor